MNGNIIFGMANSREAFAAWLTEKLGELKWTQKRLSQESSAVESSISNLLAGKITLTAEMAEKLASVPELKTTKEELLTVAGVWDEPRPSRKRDVVSELFDKLSPNGQDLAIDFIVMLAQREKEREQNKGQKEQR